MAYLTRFKLWMFLFVSSIILLLSVFDSSNSNNRWNHQQEEKDDDIGEESSLISSTSSGDDRRVIYIVIFSIFLSFFGLVVSVIPKQERLHIFESIVIWLNMIVWGAVAIFSNVLPTNSEESIEINVIAEPNIFFFGYICLIMSILLLASWFQVEVQKGNNEDYILTSTQWILLCASSIIVMISAIGFRNRRLDLVVVPSSGLNNTTMNNSTTNYTTTNQTSIYDDNNYYYDSTFNFTTNVTTIDDEGTNTTIRTSFCEASQSFNCRRVDFAIVLGAFSSVCSFGTSLGSKSSPLGCMIDLSLILFIGWLCGAIFLTFQTGPGHGLGTIFFGTWFCLLLSLNIFLSSLRQQSIEEEQKCIAANDADDILNDIRDISNEEGFLQPTLPEPDNEPSYDENDKTFFGRSLFGQQKINGDSQIESSTLSERITRSTSSGRGWSGSIFASVGAWRSRVFMDGEQIPDDIANPSNIQHHVELKNESREFNRSELWIVLCIASIVCLVSLVEILPMGNGPRKSFDKVALAIPSTSIILSLIGSITSVKRHITEIIVVSLELDDF